MLSRITTGIEAFAIEAAARLQSPGEFRGVVFCGVASINELDDYIIMPDPTEEDNAHAYLSDERYNSGVEGYREQYNLAAQVVLLHEIFSYAAPASAELADLEARAPSNT
ncbi:MAG TPA: hypothetical protein VHT05_02060 [Candidatus Elarobacter sp.]|nr:hypothetical protein [Candidatus Elarobacter sp.]